MPRNKPQEQVPSITLMGGPRGTPVTQALESQAAKETDSAYQAMVGAPGEGTSTIDTKQKNLKDRQVGISRLFLYTEGKGTHPGVQTALVT